MADNQTEKQKVQELTDKLERGLTELFNSDSYKNYLSTMLLFGRLDDAASVTLNDAVSV